MNTLLCCIGRNENKYVRYFIEYYKKLGVTNICLFDNNRDNEEDFNDSIGDYINDGYVILKDYRNRTVCQNDAYNECYELYGDKYDWIMFFDLDEFLSLNDNEYKTISEYLSEDFLEKYDMIHINWMIYGDSDKLYYENKPILERLTKPIDFYKNVSYDFPENFHVKSIIRGGLKNIKFVENSHTIINDIKCCNDIGEPLISTNAFSNISYEKCFLKHFTTKTIDEYCEKVIRGLPDRQYNPYGIEDYIKNHFFNINEITKEKLDIIYEKIGINMFYLLPNKINYKQLLYQ